MLTGGLIDFGMLIQILRMSSMSNYVQRVPQIMMDSTHYSDVLVFRVVFWTKIISNYP